MQRTRIGPFTLEEPLDSCESGNVLRGLHLERKASMAVKLLPMSIINRPMGGNTFATDVKRLQGLIHPGIARVLGGAVEEGQPYLVLELVPGESLRNLLDRRGKLPWEMAVDIADAICIALHHAHAHRVVHQRLTPNRVLIVPDGSVKLIGFDCAWADRDEVLGLRVPMSVAHYLAPEEYRGKQSASLPPCDLFSVGVILYECLTGKLPWAAASPTDLVQARRNGDAPRVAATELDCPKWLDMLVAKLLEVKRADRLSSAEETHRAIVTAKQKVAAGTGTLQQAISGKQGMFRVTADREELRQLKSHLATTERDTSPFYERVWFLVMCLALLVAGGVWSFLPPNEEALITKARPLMESDSPIDWKRAEEQFVVPLLERFPETAHAEEIHKFRQKYTMQRAETRARNNERLGHPADSEAERLFTEACKYVKAGDRLTAWDQYQSLINLFSKSTDQFDQAFVGLARMAIHRLRTEPGEGQSQSEFVEDQLATAKSLMKQGNLLGARQILDDVVSLYGENLQLRPLVDQARNLIDQVSGNPGNTPAEQ
jgi:serine/threonine protein kinase